MTMSKKNKKSFIAQIPLVSWYFTQRPELKYSIENAGKGLSLANTLMK